MAGWRFLLDENVDPKVARYLEKEGLSAEHVRGALGQGADDEDDVLPYARERDSIVVTSDVSDLRLFRIPFTSAWSSCTTTPSQPIRYRRDSSNS